MSYAPWSKGNRMLSRFKPAVSVIFQPLTRKIADVGIKPNHLTALSILMGLGASYFILSGNILEGVVFLLISVFLDALDGALARNENLKSDFGGFLDSVMDRYVDAAIIISIGVHADQIFLASLAVVGALMVSYTRARAEQIIERCDVGIAERGERMIILIFGLLFNLNYYSLLLVAVLAHLTAIHRIVFTHSQSK